MRTEPKQGFLENLKDRSQVEAVFERQVHTIFGADGSSADTYNIIGCKLLDGTELEKTDFHGNEWRHPDQPVFYKKL